MENFTYLSICQLIQILCYLNLFHKNGDKAVQKCTVWSTFSSNVSLMDATTELVLNHYTELQQSAEQATKNNINIHITETDDQRVFH